MDGSGVLGRKKNKRDTPFPAYPVLKRGKSFSHPLVADGDLYQFRRILGSEFENQVFAVGLDGLHAEEHTVGYFLIGAAVHDVPEQLLLANGEPYGMIDALLHHAVDVAAEIGIACHDGLNAFNHLFLQGVFLDVARCSGCDGATHHRVLIIGSEHQDFHVRIYLVHLLTEIDATAIGHGDIQEQHVGMPETKCDATGDECVRGIHNLGYARILDGCLQSFDQHAVVVCDVYLYHDVSSISMVTSVPAPGEE